MLKKYLLALSPALLRDAHRLTWHRDYGDDVVDALLAERVLLDGGIADWYPCGGFCMQRRSVLPEPFRPETPYYAPCAVQDECEPLQLAEDDLLLYRHNFSRALDVLCRELRVERARHAEIAIAKDIYRLGSIERGGVTADAYFAYNPTESFFPTFVAALSGSSRTSVFYTTTTKWLPDVFVASHGPGARVELVSLLDAIEIREHALRARRVSHAAANVMPSAPPAAVLLSHEGERTLTADEYAALRPAGFDLFLDGSVVRRDGRQKFYRGAHRVGDAVVDAELTEAEGAGAREFIRRARTAPLAVTEIGALQGKRGDQIFKTAWPKLDPDRRFIVREKDGYRFQPPPGGRWALVLPIAPKA